jgi:hypothetical protein
MSVHCSQIVEVFPDVMLAVKMICVITVSPEYVVVSPTLHLSRPSTYGGFLLNACLF